MANLPHARQSLHHGPSALLQTYNKRLQNDLSSMIENFTEIIKSARIEENPQVSRVTQSSYDMYQMQVRAANIVRAGESLLKLISELKTFVILNDFPSINRHIIDQNAILKKQAKTLKDEFVKLRDEFSISLFDLESEYYSTVRPQAEK